MKGCLAALFLLPAPAASAGAGQLLTYGPPPAPLFYAQHNNDYTVRVRLPGGEWQSLFAYRIRVDGHHPQDASLVYFDFDGPVAVEVEKNNGAFSRVSRLPALPGVSLKTEGQVVRFTLARPERFSLQFDGDRLHNLHILAGAPPPPAPPPGPNVRVFGPGLHIPDDGGKTFAVASGETVYLAGGAILQGNFVLKDVHDVHILGRGLIYNSGRAMELDRAQDVDIDGLITVNDDSAAAARVMNVRHSAHIRIDGISGFTAGKWSDGINISTSQHVSVDHVYLRTSDDAVVVYAVSDCPICPARDDTASSPLSYDTFDIRISHSVLWPDVAHALFVGHFGDPARPREIHDVSFDHIRVLSLDETQPAWQGAMAIFSGDTTFIHDIRFSDIRVDRIIDGKLINIVAGHNAQYNKAPGRGVSHVVLRNITFTGEGLPGASLISGLSPDAAVRDVTIDNLRIAGKRVRSARDGDIKLGPFVEGLTIR
jgi:hypothetical protein